MSTMQSKKTGIGDANSLIGFYFGLQDLEVKYFHAFIDGVDFVFIDAPLFRHRQDDIYGGNRQVKLLSVWYYIALVKLKLHLLGVLI